MDDTSTAEARMSGERSLPGIIIVFSSCNKGVGMYRVSREFKGAVLPIDLAIWGGCAYRAVVKPKRSYIKTSRGF